MVTNYLNLVVEVEFEQQTCIIFADYTFTNQFTMLTLIFLYFMSSYHDYWIVNSFEPIDLPILEVS